MSADEQRRTALLAKLLAKQRSVEIEVPIDDLIAMKADYNPRTIEPEALERLRASLRDFGVAEPVAVNIQTGTIVGGHMRVEAARLEGWTSFPVRVLDLSPAREMALNAALNNPGLQGRYVEAGLVEVFRKLAEMGEEKTLTGFTEAEIAAFEQIALAESNATEWVGMPEFTSQSKAAFKTVTCHFVDQAAVDAFAKAVGKDVKETTRYLWFPEQEIERFADKVYRSVPELSK